MSIFNNKWSEVFDFKVYDKDPKKKISNIKLSNKLVPNFVAPFNQVHELMTKASKAKGQELTSVNQVKGIDLSQIELEFAEPEVRLELGPYFEPLSVNMLKGVPPTKIGKDRENFGQAAMLVVFVKDLDQMYDSLEDDCDLSKTLFFKVMTILGCFIKKPEVWIEETRSMELKKPEKAQVLKELGIND